MVKMKEYISDEIETLNDNIKIVASLIKDVNIPFLAAINAEKLLNMLIQIRDLFEDEKVQLEKKNVILEKLPLLYLQITHIKNQINENVNINRKN